MTKGIRGNFTKTGIVCLVLLLALGTMGVGYAHWSDTVTIAGTAETGEFSSGFIDCSTNDPLGTIDPGKDKDVGSATAELASPENDGYEKVIVSITNAYPCYQCDVYVTLQNHGTVPAKIASVTVTNPYPSQLTVTTDLTFLIDTVLDPGETVDGTVSVHLEQSAAQCHTYTFIIEIRLVLWVLGGTPGYWQNWDQHYSPDQVNQWLGNIDADSDWLVPDMDGNGIINTDDMDAIRDAATGKGSTMEDRFLSQYLSTRLNVEADRLAAEASHDVTSNDPGNYLGLANPESAKLSEIIDAIEDKYDTSPNKDEFEIMKNVCCALNELAI